MARCQAAAHSANVADGSNGFLEFTARAALRMNAFAPVEIVSYASAAGANWPPSGPASQRSYNAISSDAAPSWRTVANAHA